MVDLDGDITVSDGHLALDGVDIVDLARRVGTPFFVYSPRRIRWNVSSLVNAFTRRHLDTEIFFASKACSNLWFLDQVRRAGVNVEVNSGGELWKAERAGFAPRQIIFNGVAKTRDEIGAAVRAGVRGLTVDSLYELERIAEVAGELGRTGPGRPEDRRQCADADPPRPRDRPRRQGRHRLRRRARGVLVRRRPRGPRSPRPAPARGLPDHRGRALQRGRREGARPDRGDRGRRPPPRSPERRRRLCHPLPRPAHLRAGRLLLRPSHDRRLRRGRLRTGRAPPARSQAAARTGPLHRRQHGAARDDRGEHQGQGPARRGGAARRRRALAHRRRRLQHAARTHQLPLVLPHDRRQPGRRARRHAVSPGRAALRRRRRVRRRRRDAVSPFPPGYGTGRRRRLLRRRRLHARDDEPLQRPAAGRRLRRRRGYGATDPRRRHPRRHGSRRRRARRARRPARRRPTCPPHPLGAVRRPLAETKGRSRAAGRARARRRA